MCDNDFKNIKVAGRFLTIKEVLSKSTGAKKSKKCRVQFLNYNVSQDLWRFKAHCSESYSKTSGWEVNIWLEREDDKPPADLEFLAMCKCPAWVYWGSEYQAKIKDYLYGRLRGNGAFPKIRDRELKNMVCKHVYLCLQEMMKGRKFF